MGNKQAGLRALVVDEETETVRELQKILTAAGWTTVSAVSGSEAMFRFQEFKFDLVFLEVWLKRLDGIQILQKMKEIREQVPVVLMSRRGTIETAVRATKLGAFDFLEKPVCEIRVRSFIEHAEKIKALHNCESHEKACPLIGESPIIASIHRNIRVVAPRNSWVLITGENGTGKEVVARNIHLQSHRAEQAFVAMNCAAIPEELIESELFGFERGAFTHALSMKRGKLESAHQGTLFLDEIADMSLKIQAKILRVLQEQSFERLGGTKTISVDVRVIAATNKDLQEEIEKGNFREDLFYRLNVIPIHLSPLRERSGDILILANHFLEQISLELNEPHKSFAPLALEALESYPWPGNVRELRNLVERMSIFSSGTSISLSDLPDYISRVQPPPKKDLWADISQRESLKEARAVFERSFIVEKLAKHAGNVSKTAAAIGLERSYLHRKLKTYAIKVGD